MHLQTLDWIVVAASLAVCFVPALFFGRRSGKSTTEFFASGRSVPWWLAGLSMVATTFSSDTPNLVTDIVRRQGVAGNWQWWAFTLTGVATVFFFARLWRRSGVLTDLEFYELRYSGKAARVVRGFRALYLGLFFNCVIMATVNLAAVKIANILFGLADWQTLIFIGLLNVAFAAHSGLWGVLVIDMIQFFIKMSAVIAAAYFAVKSVGGLSVLVAKVGAMPGPVEGAVPGFNYLSLLPSFATQPRSLGPRGGRVHHAPRRAVVGGVVSGRGAGRRQLHRAADAGLEVRARLPGRRPLLQRRALRAQALAVDSRGALLARGLPDPRRHPPRLPEPRPQDGSATTSPTPP